VPTYTLGLDFGTESVRAVLADVRTGHLVGQAIAPFACGVIDRELPIPHAKPLPPDSAFQHPADWLSAALIAGRDALAAGNVSPADVVGIGVDFTSCTILPTQSDGTPLCLSPRFEREPMAWPKLWKHHGAHAEADRINDVARNRNEPWLPRYGGVISLEWFFPKMLETLNQAPHVHAATDVWLEAGDWFVWQLTGGVYPGCRTDALVRSTCQAGYKAMWNRHDGYPSRDFFAAVHPDLADVVSQKMPGRLLAPGQRAGTLSPTGAKLLGLREGTPVSTAIIDAHSGVPGSGVADPGTRVMVMGTSACHMVNATVEHLVPGVAGVVEDGILPGFFGYETGQASVGDAFAWIKGILGTSHEELTRLAHVLPPGSGGVLALDWLNGCRTPLMDGRLSGAFVGLTLATRPEQLYRALLESTALGTRWIRDTLAGAGVPVNHYVAGGGLPTKSPLLMQICADVLNAEIRLAASDQAVALGAAILGALAAGQAATGHPTIASAIRAMARLRDDLVYRPDPTTTPHYDALYSMYRDLAESTGPLPTTMRRLRELS
jgi:L-ribulokinase